MIRSQQLNCIFIFSLQTRLNLRKLLKLGLHVKLGLLNHQLTITRPENPKLYLQEPDVPDHKYSTYRNPMYLTTIWLLPKPKVYS